jgi:hypothetical protein
MSFQFTSQMLSFTEAFSQSQILFMYGCGGTDWLSTCESITILHANGFEEAIWEMYKKHEAAFWTHRNTLSQ